MKRILISIIALTILFTGCVEKKKILQSFSNPVIYSDVPDIDIIRVGSDYYMVSTTMHLMPGVPIMKSKDLVNWELISYVVPEIKDSPLYDLEGGDVYGQGQWAASLRYHEGKFYVFFATNRPLKTYIYSTEDPSGKWEKVMDLDERYHDTSLFFDDDGRIYIAGGSGNIRIRELKSDLSGIKEDGLNVEVINGEKDNLKNLLEGTHLCKYDGKYYMFLIWWPSGGIRTQLAFRSDNIAGPYEHKVILSNSMDRKYAGVAQGGIIDTEDGEWYGFLFQDRGAVGRVPVLTPCTWVDGWPMLGDQNGVVPKIMQKMCVSESAKPLVISDSFDSSELAINWQWNHNPDNNLWSLSERKGYMRLKTGKVVNSIFEARNMLSQRTEGPACSGIVALDIKGMKDGDVAGLSAYCAEPGIISVNVEDEKKYIVMKDRETEMERIELLGDRVYFRLDCDFNEGRDKANFYYSYDNVEWNKIGTEFQMVYNLKHFMGNRFGIFNYATKTNGGYVDIDFFEYKRILL